MSLVQAVRAIVVLVAVLFGAPSNALAHAGHEHASLSPVTASLSTKALRADTSSFDSITFLADPTQSVPKLFLPVHTTGVRAVVSAGFQSQSGTTACAPGACCCQGASSCGMGGHCCASLFSSSEKWFGDLTNHVRYHLARLGWTYPEMIFGLDRPPKV